MDVNNIDVSNRQFYISVKNFQDLMNILNVGDVIKGRVMENNGSGMYLINFLGHELTSKSNNSFSPGDIIYGKVVDMNEALTLKLMTDTQGNPLDAANLDSSEVLLEKNGLPVSPLNISIVSAMKQQGIDINSSSLDAIANAVQKMGLTSAEDIKAMAFLEGNSMPLNKSMVQSLSSYFGNQDGVGKDVTDVLNLLRENFLSTKDININDMANGIENALLRTSALENEDIESMFRNSGLMYENKLKNAVLANGDLLTSLKPKNIDEAMLSLLKSGQSIIKSLSNTTNPDLLRLTKDISNVLSGNINSQDIPKLMTNLMEAYNVSQDKNLGEYLKGISDYISTPDGGKTSETLKELLLLQEHFKGILGSGELDKFTYNGLMRDMKYFLYSGNTSALDKIINLTSNLEDKSAALFAESALKVKDLFNDFLAQQNEHSKLVGQQKNQFMQTLNAAEDLKGVLLKANDYFAEQLKNNPNFFKENSFERTMESLDKAIMGLQGEQIFNAKPNNDYAYYSLQLPVAEHADIKSGKIEMFFKKDKDADGKRQKEDNDGFKVAFLLDMTALGPVKIITDVKDHAINCQIMVTNEKIKQFFDENIPELKEEFEKLSYEIGNMACVLDQRVGFEANSQVLEDVNNQLMRKINILV